MEYEQDEQKEGGVLQRIKESPRTVSALIIILIVAAAIYAFSGDETQQVATGPEDETTEATQEEQSEEADEEGEVNEEGVTDVTAPAQSPAPDAPAAPTPQDGQPTPTPVNQETLAESANQLPEASRTDSAFVEVAQAGDGYTQLARRAATRWLAENNAGYNVTNEHRIYIEDYIQNRIGTSGLSLGQQQEISFELMREAVAAAGQLSEQQLQNLSQYTHAL